MIPSNLNLPTEQPKDFSSALARIALLSTQLKSLHTTALIYEEQIRSFKRSLYGKRSEKWIPLVEQGSFIFNKAEDVVHKEEKAHSAQEETTTITHRLREISI